MIYLDKRESEISFLGGMNTCEVRYDKESEWALKIAKDCVI